MFQHEARHKRIQGIVASFCSSHGIDPTQAQYADVDQHRVSCDTALITSELSTCAALAISYDNNTFLCHISMITSNEVCGWVEAAFKPEELASTELSIEIWLGNHPIHSEATVFASLIKLNLFSHIINLPLFKKQIEILYNKALLNAERLSKAHNDVSILTNFISGNYASLLNYAKGIEEVGNLSVNDWRQLLNEIKKIIAMPTGM